MSLLTSRMQFWLLTFLFFNSFSIALMTVKGVWDLPTSANLHELLIGFFLQLPALALVVFVDVLIFLLSASLPLSKVWRFILRFTFQYLFILMYLASLAIYLGVGVFLSLEVITIFFLDFDQIMPLLLSTASVAVLIVLFINIMLFVPWQRLRIFQWSFLQKNIIAIYSIAAVLCVFSLVFTLYQGHRQPQFSVAVFKNTFPHNFLLGQIIEELISDDLAVKPLNKSNLNEIISLKDYRESAGELSRKPPVFVIMLESISHNHLSFTGYQKHDITPNLDKLFSHSTFFDRTYTPSNHSNLAQGSILSSQYAMRTIRLETFKSVDFPKPMLFDILHEYGYETAIYSAQDESWLGMQRFIKANDAKIDHFKHAPDFSGYFKFYDNKIDDADLITEVGQYLTTIRDQSKPPLLYLNLQRTHYDYRLKPDVKGYYGESEPVTGMFFDYGIEQVDAAILQYDNALHYVDEQMGRFIHMLKEQGIYDESIIIVTADHGEAFYENGYATHATSMYDAQIRSFLSIKLPQQKQGISRNDAVSSVDMIPMALEALGLPNHPAFQGFQLLKRQRSDEEPIFAVGQSVVRAEMVVQYPWKFFISEKEGAVLLNLDEDPKEKNNLLLKETEKAKQLKMWLDTHRQNQLNYYAEDNLPLRSQYYAPQYRFEKTVHN